MSKASVHGVSQARFPGRAAGVSLVSAVCLLGLVFMALLSFTSNIYPSRDDPAGPSGTTVTPAPIEQGEKLEDSNNRFLLRGGAFKSTGLGGSTKERALAAGTGAAAHPKGLKLLLASHGRLMWYDTISGSTTVLHDGQVSLSCNENEMTTDLLIIICFI